MALPGRRPRQSRSRRWLHSFLRASCSHSSITRSAFCAAGWDFFLRRGRHTHTGWDRALSESQISAPGCPAPRATPRLYVATVPALTCTSSADSDSARVNVLHCSCTIAVPSPSLPPATPGTFLRPFFVPPTCSLEGPSSQLAYASGRPKLLLGSSARIRNRRQTANTEV